MLSTIGAIISFPIIIYLTRKKADFGISLLIGSLVIALLSIDYFGIDGVLKIFLKAVIYSVDEGKVVTTTLELSFIIILISIFATFLKENGDMEKLIDSLRSIISRGSILAAIPAIFGLLPIQGGALFSAPMIEQEGKKLNISKEKLSLLNVWFRHTWFPIYPLSIAMIVLSGLAGINVYMIAALQIPIFIIMVSLGFAILYTSVKDKKLLKEKTRDRKLKGLIYFVPLVIPIIVSAPLISYMNISSTRALLLSIPIGIISLIIIDRIPLRKSISLIKKGISIRFALAIVTIMIFREFFSQSELMETLRKLPLSSLHPFLLLIFIPLLLGFATGHNLIAISLSYPILEPLSHLGSKAIFSSIIYMATFMGYLFSPVHLCVVVTCEYFKSDLTKIYKVFIPISLLVAGIHVLIMSILLRLII